MSKPFWIFDEAAPQLIDDKALAKLVDEHVQDAIRWLFKDRDVSNIYLPMMWFPRDGWRNSRPPEDPLTVRFTLDCHPLQLYRDRSLTREIAEMCNDLAADGSFIQGARQISKALHEAADRVDAAIKEGEQAIAEDRERSQSMTK